MGGLLLKPAAPQDTCPGHSKVAGSVAGRRSGGPSPALSQGTRAPALPTTCSVSLTCRAPLVPVMPAVPDRQGVITPLQVKLLEGQLDHLWREQGLGSSRQGPPGEPSPAWKTARSSMSRHSEHRDTTP